MAKAKKPMPIHLSNRTAIALRKTAQRVRGAWLIAMGVFAMLATVTAVYLGFLWLPAVPLTLLAAGAIIALMLLISRSQYLLLVSQAICTEAASRGMEERMSEQKRRKKAIEQLAEIRADVRDAQQKGMPQGETASEAALLFDLLTGREHGEEEIRRMRRGEEDDELYGADYRAQAQEDDDLRPAKPAKKAQPPERKVPSAAQGTKPVAAAAPEEKAVSAAGASQGQSAPRRRRRSAPEQTASLKLIRSDRAQ